MTFMNTSDITAIDFFCGCGGSTTAAVNAGVRVTHAINHWAVAIESHNTNYPSVEHDCIDVRTIPANRYPQATIGLFSPECGGHAAAAGKKRVVGQLDLFETEEQDIGRERSRMTMMEVCRFTEALNLEIAIVENVPEVTRWYLFSSWLWEMHKLGYYHQIVSFNSQFAPPIPQSRDRVYIVFWKRGNRRPDLEYRPIGYCHSCTRSGETYQWWKNQRVRVGRYQRQYLYRCSVCREVVEPYAAPAVGVIDWSLDCPKIGDRPKLKKRPLKPATLRRIALGLQKFGNVSVTTNTVHSQSQIGNANSFDALLTTQIACQSKALVPPFLIEMYGTGTAKRLSQPLGTITTSGSHHALVQPFLVQYNGKSVASSLADAMPTITTVDRCGLVQPPGYFLVQYYGREDATSSINSPIPTVTTEKRHALIKSAVNIEDCGFRMLQPEEIKLAMGFEAQYVIIGTKKEQIKQAGNAVTPGAEEWLIRRCIKSLS